MTKAEKLKAVNRRASGPDARQTMPLPAIPDYFKQDPQARVHWKRYEGDRWEWVKNLKS